MCFVSNISADPQGFSFLAIHSETRNLAKFYKKTLKYMFPTICAILDHFLQNLVEFIRPTSYYTKNRSKVLCFSLCATQYLAFGR